MHSLLSKPGLRVRYALPHSGPRRIGGRGTRTGWYSAGAVFSVYSTFITRGEDVILPANTPVKISLRTRVGEAGLPAKRLKSLHSLADIERP